MLISIDIAVYYCVVVQSDELISQVKESAPYRIVR